MKAPLHVPSLQTMKMRLRKFKCLAQSHVANLGFCFQAVWLQSLYTEIKNQTNTRATTNILIGNLWKIPGNHATVFKMANKEEESSIYPAFMYINCISG